MGIKYKSVNLSKSIAIPKARPMYVNIIRSAFFGGRILIDREMESGQDILIFYSHSDSRRDDYDEIIHNLDKLLEGFSKTRVIYRSFFLRGFFSFLKHVYNNLLLFKKFSGKWCERVEVLFLISRAMSIVDEIEEFYQKSDYKVVVTFSDAHFIDSLFTQFAKKKEAKTVTLQHGQYFLSQNNMIENFVLENMESDFFCCWGGKTSKELDKVGIDTKAVLLGSLRNYSRNIVMYDKRVVEQLCSSKVICIMLNADNCESSNVALIEVMNAFAKNHEYRYIIRYHPKNNKRLYEKFFSDSFAGVYGECPIGKIAFSVVYTSGVLVEILCRGELFFIFKDIELPEIFEIDGITFSSHTELSVCIQSLKLSSEKVQKFNEIKAEFIVGGDNKGNYRAFFKKLLLTTNR